MTTYTVTTMPSIDPLPGLPCFGSTSNAIWTTEDNLYKKQWTSDHVTIGDGTGTVYPSPNSAGDWIGDYSRWADDKRRYGHNPWDANQPFDPGEFDYELLKKALGAPAAINPGWRELEKVGDDGRTYKCLSTDLPGVHINTLDVRVKDGVLHVVGQRFDTSETVEKTFELGEKYDPSTSEATLSHGVFTITVKLHEAFEDREIPVKSGD